MGKSTATMQDCISKRQDAIPRGIERTRIYRMGISVESQNQFPPFQRNNTYLTTATSLQLSCNFLDAGLQKPICPLEASTAKPRCFYLICFPAGPSLRSFRRKCTLTTLIPIPIPGVYP